MNETPKRDARGIYHIAFDTLEFPGMIVATRVHLQREIVRDRDTTRRTDLRDDPIYRDLFQYCIANPPPGIVINTRKIRK